LLQALEFSMTVGRMEAPLPLNLLVELLFFCRCAEVRVLSWCFPVQGYMPWMMQFRLPQLCVGLW
jgi:hypothetical protein